MSFGITHFGAYVPKLRLERLAIANAHAWMAPALKAQAKGARAFCSWDEDAVTMAVEAVRDGLPAHVAASLRDVWLASTTLPYDDYQNAAIVAAAIGAPQTCRTLDISGSQRAGISGLAHALESRSEGMLLVASERPKAKPASAQEMTYGAGAAAFRLGRDSVIAKFVGRGSAASQFADHVRGADGDFDNYWEERWIRDEGYAKLIPIAIDEALKASDLAIGDIAHIVMPSPLKGAVEAIAKRLRFGGNVADNLGEWCGYAGAAHGLLVLSDVLARAKAGEKILVAGFGQGVDALVLETTDEIAYRSSDGGLNVCRANGVITDAYLQMASFYGEIQPDWGMRGEKAEKASLSAHARVADRLAGFVAGRCRHCGTVQFPRLAYCVNPECAWPASQFDDHRLADEPARVLTYTADWLSYCPAPPLYVGFAQFASGARLMMEIVDVGPEGLEVGTPLRMVFRLKEHDRVRGFNRYFWKATPIAR